MGKLLLIGIGVVIGAALLPIIGPMIVPAFAIVGGIIVIGKLISLGGK